jgi:hypothetical protein
MLKMSPFITFLLYCLFVSFTIYYLTKDKLDEMSRYMLIGVLILPYIFMDQAESFSNILKDKSEKIENYSPQNPIPEQVVPKLISKSILEQPKIILNENEKVENLKAVEDANKKIFTSEDLKNIIKRIKENKLLENYGSMYTGEVAKTYNEDQKFTSQLLKPLGENGNGFTNEWDHDYILLNTDKWGPALNPPPVCKTEKTCPVCPNLTTGYPLMLRDFDSSRRITAPIKADISEMNNTTSNNSTNATTSNNSIFDPVSMSSNEIKDALQSPASSESIGKQLNRVLSNFPVSERPSIISNMAKHMGISNDTMMMIINDPNSQI